MRTEFKIQDLTLFFSELHKSTGNVARRVCGCWNLRAPVLCARVHSASSMKHQHRERRSEVAGRRSGSLERYTRRLRRASFELERSRLLRAAGQPFPAKFFGDLFVGECTPRFDICSPAGHGLDNVQVVEHVIQTAVVRESIQHGLHSFFGLHQLFLPGHISASISRTRVARSVWLTS